MELGIPEYEIREFLGAIESGAVRLTSVEEPQHVYAGVVEYAASNGWRLAVFNDCNEWDYLEWVEAPDGRRVDYDQLCDSSDLAQYEPEPSVAWERYGIPGAMKFRCTCCGVDFKYAKDNVFLCGPCRQTS
jgi:hypothetical protein